VKAQLQRQIDERNFAMGTFAVSDLIGIDVLPHTFEQDETGTSMVSEFQAFWRNSTGREVGSENGSGLVPL